ncbi:MAG: glycoside hydrolase domain-containing protein, partial [Armatimonadota bacterium]
MIVLLGLLNGLGLAQRIVNGGARQLSGPMKLVASMDGKDVEVRSGRPKVKRLTEAAVLLQGSARLGGLEIRTDARVEFDGFVLNAMELVPRRPTRIDRLSLVVQMAKAEAPCFVTTAGGWAAYHGWTPERWDSRETALGSMIYKFVPYVFLTDSERGFCCFVDSVKGFSLDPEAPVQELSSDGATVTFRLNFITKPTVLDEPRTMQYGWMVTPQKPQPPGWRGYHIAHSKPYPGATCLFWSDADWAVLWPYYSSPFPWDYEKSRAELQRRKDNGIIPCVGNIAHAIARYQDYKGRRFPELAADWGTIPGNLANGNVARGRGPNDFQLWHWDQWVKKSGLVGLYFDETYLSDDANYLTGGAFLLEDEQLQPGYNYLGLREMSKRLRYMFHANGVPRPNIWFHTTSGQPVYAWMPDMGMEGENVAPTGYDNDYMDCLPASRLRAICMGANLGIAPTIMCQAQRHWKADWSSFMIHQFVGWILAHDCLPEQVGFWDVLAAELGLWRDDVRFLPYWKPGLGIESSDEGLLASAHARPGHAVLWAVNTSAEDKRARIKLDLAGLGLDADALLAFDAETGDRHHVRADTLTVDVPKRMWRAIRLKAPRLLADDETFIARFDGDRIAADECLGSPHGSVAGKRDAGSPLGPGKSGGGLRLDNAVAFSARHHALRDCGSVSFQLELDPTAQTGTLITLGGMKLALARGKLLLQIQKQFEEERLDRKTNEAKTTAVM